MLLNKRIRNLVLVPRKLVQLNPRLSQILSKVLSLRTYHSSEQNIVVSLLRDSVMITCYPSKQCIER